MSDESPGWEEYFQKAGERLEREKNPLEAARQALRDAYFLLKVVIDEATAAQGRNLINMALMKLEHAQNETVPALAVFDVDVIGQTANDATLPDWALACVEEWRSILHLNAWAIRLKTDPCPQYDPETLAYVELMPNIMTAHITIRDSIPASLDGLPEEQVRYWESALIHELIHVFIARVTDFIEKDVMPELAPSARRIAEATLTREVEPVVELLASVLYQLKRDKHG